MGYALSTKLDATLRYAGGLYGLAASVLSDIASALANAATAQTAASAAQATATTAQSDLTAHAGTGGTSHAAASGSAAGFMSAAHFTRVSGVEDGAQAVTESRVRTALAAATTFIGVNGQKLSSLADPTTAQDAATKAYVDAVATGLDCKASVRVVDTVGVTLSGAQVVDGVTLAGGDRVLRAVGNSALNGIYVANNSVAWQRATDADTSAEVTGGMFTFVTDGTTNADSGWVLITNDAITLGTTALQFTQFSGAGQIAAGAGLTKTGNQLDVVANADGSIVVAADDIKVGVISDAQHGNRGGGGVHALATGAAHGFCSATDKTKLDALAAGQSVTLGRVTVDCLLETPTLLTGTGTVDVDAALKNDFLIVLGGATTLNLKTFGAGRQGNIWVQQDATGARSLAWTLAGAASPTGWMLLKDTGLSDLNPAQAANALTMYSYAMFALGGTNYVQISKSLLG